MNPRITDNRAEYNEKRFQYFGGEVDMYELLSQIIELFIYAGNSLTESVDKAKQSIRELAINILLKSSTKKP